jgi:hypothetical protein
MKAVGVSRSGTTRRRIVTDSRRPADFDYATAFEQPNSAVEQAAGSQSLAAAAHHGVRHSPDSAEGG